MSARRGRSMALGGLFLGASVLAIAAFAFKGRLVEEYYIWRLSSSDDEEKVRAIQKLGEIGSTGAIPILLDLAESDSKSPVNTVYGTLQMQQAQLPHAAKALVKIGLPAVPALLARLGRVDAGKRYFVPLILVEMGTAVVPRLAPELEHADPEYARRVAAILGKVTSEAARASTARAMDHLREKDYLRAMQEAALALEENRWNFEANYTLAFAALLAGDYAQAIRHFEMARRVDPGAVLVFYNLACAHALSQHTEEALDSLEAAVSAGFADHEHIQADPDLASLRPTDRYRRLLAQLEGQGN